MTRLCVIGSCVHTSVQLTSLRGGAPPLSYEWMHRVGSVVFVATSWVLPTVAPVTALRCAGQGSSGEAPRRPLPEAVLAALRRWHRPFLVLLRVLFFAFPLLRSNSGIQRSLEALPTPGALGCVLDLLKVVWGELLPRAGRLRGTGSRLRTGC